MDIQTQNNYFMDYINNCRVWDSNSQHAGQSNKEAIRLPSYGTAATQTDET